MPSTRAAIRTSAKSFRQGRNETSFQKRQRRSPVSTPKQPSALSLRRISDIEVQQVMHATQSDIKKLNTHLNQWGVSRFHSWSVLLRALTHPSISNWAERVQALPKRSLGPNTLELLGDRVVGLCVSNAIHQNISTNYDQNSQHDAQLWKRLEWYHSPQMLQQSLTGNRGMAKVSDRFGIAELLRWEKWTPPSAHRTRVDENGRDPITGILSNVEVNAYAAAYEAVAAAIYLDGGIHSAQQFVQNTLLTNPLEIQSYNYTVEDYEEALLRTVTRLLNGSVSFLPNRKVIGKTANYVKRSFERWQLEILDLQSLNDDAHTNPAHELYYCGVTLRKMCDIGDKVNEMHLLSLASHFSVENARIAALTQARTILMGKSKVERETYIGPKVCKTLGLREIIYGKDRPIFTANLKSKHGQWVFQSNYKHLAHVLQNIEAPGWNDMTIEDDETICNQLKIRCSDEGENGYDFRWGEPIHSGKTGKQYYEHDNKSNYSIQADTNRINDCIGLGREIDEKNELIQSHEGLRCHTTDASGDDIYEKMKDEVNFINEMSDKEATLQIRGYQSIGQNVNKLWAVQQSIDRCGQDRNEVMEGSLRRLSNRHMILQEMMGKDFCLGIARDLKFHPIVVGVGICSKRLGLGVVLQWLNGAEQRYEESKTKL